MGKYTKADILRMVKEDDVEFIRLQIFLETLRMLL